MRFENSIAYEGIYEMMSERTYIAWAGKAKNGSVDPGDASREWHRLAGMPKAVVDTKGTSERYRRRVAVRVKDLIRLTDKETRSRGYDLEGKVDKKVDDDSIALLEKRLQSETHSRAGSSGDITDVAKSLALAASAAAEDMEDIGGIGGAAGGKATVMDFARLKAASKERVDEPAEEDAGGDNSGDDDDLNEHEVAKKQKVASAKHWWNRDTIISSAISQHKTYMTTTKEGLIQAAEQIKEALKQVTPDVAAAVKIERLLAETRRHAIKLVLAVAEAPPPPKANATATDAHSPMNAARRGATVASPSGEGKVAASPAAVIPAAKQVEQAVSSFTMLCKCELPSSD